MFQIKTHENPTILKLVVAITIDTNLRGFVINKGAFINHLNPGNTQLREFIKADLNTCPVLSPLISIILSVGITTYRSKRTKLKILLFLFILK